MNKQYIREIVLIVLLSLFPLKAQVNMAVLEFDGKGMSQVEASILTDRLRTELFRTGKFVVIEREMMDEILTEQGFQQTGCTTAECIVEIGRLVGVEQMVGGSVIKFGNLYSISARIIGVETGKIINTATYDHEGRLEDLLKFGMKKVADDLVEEKPVASEEKSEASEPKEVIAITPPKKEIKPSLKSSTRSPIIMKRSIFWVSFLHEGNKLKQSELKALLKTYPLSSKKLEESRRNKLIGTILGLGGVAYTYSTVKASIDDFNSGKISDEESIAMEERAVIVLSVSLLGEVYFILKGSKQFMDAIDIYNGNIE